jgi:xylulokinase
MLPVRCGSIRLSGIGDDTLLAETGLNRSHMPTLYEGCQIVGELTATAATALNLPRVPVVAGAGDNAGGAVGVGVIDPGQGFLSLGTSGVLFVVSAAHHACPERTVHAFCHCLPNRWHQMSVSLSAANSLAWLARTVEREVGDLLARLDASGKTETSVLFLPYLSGERTPHKRPARGRPVPRPEQRHRFERPDAGGVGRRRLFVLRWTGCVAGSGQ